MRVLLVAGRGSDRRPRIRPCCLPLNIGPRPPRRQRTAPARPTRALDAQAAQCRAVEGLSEGAAALGERPGGKPRPAGPSDDLGASGRGSSGRNAEGSERSEDRSPRAGAVGMRAPGDPSGDGRHARPNIAMALLPGERGWARPARPAAIKKRRTAGSVSGIDLGRKGRRPGAGILGDFTFLRRKPSAPAGCRCAGRGCARVARRRPGAPGRGRRRRRSARCGRARRERSAPPGEAP